MSSAAQAEVALGRLPDFLVIGAMKCGTTSLYHYLREHPQVFMPQLKAPEFFAEASNWHRGVDWYRRQFAGAGAEVLAIGEASNVYTKYPRYMDVPARIAGHIPDARLIYVVRDPVERIRSHYRTRVAEGTESTPFDVAVFENPIYLDYSRYAMQVFGASVTLVPPETAPPPVPLNVANTDLLPSIRSSSGFWFPPASPVHPPKTQLVPAGTAVSVTVEPAG